MEIEDLTKETEKIRSEKNLKALQVMSLFWISDNFRLINELEESKVRNKKLTELCSLLTAILMMPSIFILLVISVKLFMYLFS